MGREGGRRLSAVTADARSPPLSGQARPAARSACATTARRDRARVRERPGQRLAGRQATAERSCGARARTAPARIGSPEPCPSPSSAPTRRQAAQSNTQSAPTRRVPEPEQVPLDRIRPGLQPIVTRRDTAAFTPRASDERTDHDAAGLKRQRRPRRPIPVTARVATRSGEVLQRHRQRPWRTHRAPRATPASRRSRRSWPNHARTRGSALRRTTTRPLKSRLRIRPTSG